MALHTYLNFDGNCRQAFEFYRSVFGGQFDVIQTFGEGPADMDVPADAKNRVMHVSLPVLGSTLMGSDTMPGNPQPLVQGNNFSITVVPQNRQQCEELFAAISAGGEVTMPLQETFWGAYFGSCRDKFEVNWMFNLELAPAGN